MALPNTAASVDRQFTMWSQTDTVTENTHEDVTEKATDNNVTETGTQENITTKGT